MSDEEIRTAPCCGYVWRTGGDDPKGPIFWNPYNRAVQCHHCGAQYYLPGPPRHIKPRESTIQDKTT